MIKITNKTLIIFLIQFILHNSVILSQQYTISGIVKDSLSGENLSEANVFVSQIQQGTFTNKYGFFSISLPQGDYAILISFVGYEKKYIYIKLDKNIRIDVELKEVDSSLDEVIVSSDKNNIINTGISVNKLSIKRIKETVTATGEPDVMKTLQLLPGIQAATEGATNLYVRGGSHDQNLYLLDEAPIYNPAHAVGFFSIFNDDILKDISIYKGFFPARYGGRLSSVVDLTMREGDDKNYHANLRLGMIASRLTIEGPIAKGKASFIISGRYSYSGLVLNALHEINSKAISNDNDIWFYDLNAKINYNINAKNHIYFSAYSGYDNFYCITLNDRNKLTWGNFTSTIRWNHIFSNKLFANFTIYHSRYRYSYKFLEDIRNFLWKSNLYETGIKADFSYYRNPKNTIKFGVNGIYHFFSPGSISKADTSSIIKYFKLDNKKSAELNFYIENEHSISSKIMLSYGLRASFFANMGAATVYNYNDDMTRIKDSSVYKQNELINTYNSIEPRLSAHYKLNSNNAFKFAYSHSVQYLHLLSNSTVGLPTDIWLPPDKYIKPQKAHQYTLGYYSVFSNKKWELSVESYYKQLIDIMDFKDNADLFLNKHVETQILLGTGKSYGIEFLLEKKREKLTAEIAYTLAKTQYKIDGINQGDYYSPRYDIRHSLSLSASYKLSKSWTVSSEFQLASGGYISIPKQIFSSDGVSFFDYGKKNSYKMPAYHNLNLAATYNNPKNKIRKLKRQWIFSIYNIYNRKNIYSLFVKQHSHNLTMVSVYKMYLYGIVPTVSFNIKF